MAKIFRKFRVRFLNEKKIRNYFLYAIGEIVLVVLGILIAVAINNWNIQNNNRNQEINILNQLLIEYDENLKEIDGKIAMRNLIIQSVEKLIYYADNKINDNMLDSISFHLNRTKFDPTFDPSNGVTNEILSSGKLYILENKNLKSQLTSWSGVVAELSEQEQLTAKIVYEKYIPYLTENFDVRSTMNQQIDKQMINFFTTGKTRTLNVPRKIDKQVLVDILSDSAIQNYMILIGRMHQSGNMQSIDTRKRILEIQDNINSEIKMHTIQKK